MLKLLHDTTRRLIDTSGLYVRRKSRLPSGINWAWDLKKLVPGSKATCLVDVGANVGQTVQFMRREFPNAVIHAFEPVPDAFQQLSQNVVGMPRITLHQVGVSDRQGSVQIRYRGASQTNTIEPSARRDATDTTTIALNRLDDVFREHCQTDDIYLLKTDTEGHDAHVLRGASELLHQGRVIAVLTEVTFDDSDKLHTQFSEVATVLSPLNYQLCSLYDTRHLQRQCDGGTYCNALFINRRVLPQY